MEKKSCFDFTPNLVPRPLGAPGVVVVLLGPLAAEPHVLCDEMDPACIDVPNLQGTRL